MNLLIVTHYLDNHKELGEMTSANKRAYADRHGYDFFEQVGNYTGWGFDFQRIQLIYDLLFHPGWFSESTVETAKAVARKFGKSDDIKSIKREPDAIWWLGCDTMIMNETLPVTNFLKPEGRSLYIHKDINGINNDSFVIFKNNWTEDWLKFVMSKEPEYRGDCWESQRVFQHYVERDEWKNGCVILEHPGINSYFYDKYSWPESTPGHIKKGDLLLHLPGMNLQQRLEIFRSQRVADLIIK